jgi:mono/diheme cytochrome c family protein
VKNFLLGVLFTLLVVILGGFAYLRLGYAEVRGDVPPSNWERALLFSAAHASVRRRAPELPNPVSPTDENLIAGGKIYSDECAGCHGAVGKPDQTGDSLYPPIPQLPFVGTDYTEAQIFWVAKHGVRLSGMFANGKWDSDQKLWTVAAYIKRIKSLPPRVQQELAKRAPPK